MLFNYLNIAIRNLLKHRFFFLINTLGLSVGITCNILIALWIQDELSFDRFHKNVERIHLIYQTSTFGNEAATNTRTPYPIAPLLKENISGIENFTRVDNLFQGKRSVENQGEVLELIEPDVIGFTDPGFFDIFSFALIDGDPHKVLSDPYTVVITEARAKKYFGAQNPLGRVITLREVFNNSTIDLKITGVMEGMPDNSHVHKDMLISMATADAIAAFRTTRWNFASQYSYVLLAEDANVASVKTAIPGLVATNVPESLRKNITFNLFPLQDIYLRSDFDYNIGPVGDILKVRIFAAVALLTIIIACINYINLATVQGAGRSREVGMRKALGASKKQVIAQFITESILISAISLIVAISLLTVLLPTFNQFTGKSLEIKFLLDPHFIVTSLLVIGLVGIVSGSYPAFYLSAIGPVKALKGSAGQMGQGASILRKGLVIFQFAISVALIFSSLIIYKQWIYLRSKNLGFQTQQVITLPVQSNAFVRNYFTFKANLLQNSAFEHISASNKSLTERFFDFTTTTRSTSNNDTILAFGAIDFDFFETMDIKLVAGRTFMKHYPADSNQTIIINESAKRFFGFEDPLGEILRIGSEKEPKTIIGVVEDFHFEDLYTKITPMVFFITHNYLNEVVIKINTDNLAQATQAIQKEWDKYGLIEPFTYSFLDERVDKMYKKEEHFLQLFATFTGLAIIIACLGAFGLVSFIIVQRTKEMAIRKVLGASSLGLVKVLSKGFLLLVLMAFFIISPVAWYWMGRWLESYAYRTEIHWWTFAVTGLVVLSVSLLTISYQSIRTARVNPAEILRSE